MTAMPKNRGGMIVAVDPSKWFSGVALFSQLVLRGVLFPKWAGSTSESQEANASVWIAEQVKAVTGGHVMAAVVIENQTTRQLKDQKGSQNDLIPLAYTAGAIFALVPAQERIKVHQPTWGSSRGKDAIKEHVMKRLSPVERAILEASKLQNNEHVIDAVGIGLWATARM
jgi:hypothetical protein